MYNSISKLYNTLTTVYLYFCDWMKKFIVTIIAFLYLFVTAGATVHIHYCMNKMVDWGLWHNDDKKCGKCGMDKSKEKDNGCCKDEHKQVKLDNDHKGSASYELTELTSSAITLPEFEIFSLNIPSVTQQHPVSHAPPRSGDLAVYILNHVFRI